jgi:hypothetical protein
MPATPRSAPGGASLSTAKAKASVGKKLALPVHKVTSSEETGSGSRSQVSNRPKGKLSLAVDKVVGSSQESHRKNSSSSKGKKAGGAVSERIVPSQLSQRKTKSKDRRGPTSERSSKSAGAGRGTPLASGLAALSETELSDWDAAASSSAWMPSRVRARALHCASTI